ncbi:MAG: VanZ family protein [Ruminococcus sp.]|nr:VanZ family protein [Ruminococcus sp.]
MRKIRLNKFQIFCGIMTIAVMVCIFLFSCENADDSSDTSGNFVNLIISIFYGDYDELPLWEQEEIRGNISHFIRKTAHFTIFAALGFFAFLTSGQKKLLCKGTAAVLIFCGLYAVSDEIHQYFVPGRACMLRDMLIDTCGSLAGIAAALAALKIFSRK